LDSDANDLLKNEAEFKAYHMIATAGSLDGFRLIADTVKDLQKPEDVELIKEAVSLVTVIS